ncbi:membrane-bound lytic murein transglycosylase D precursor [Pectobacterium atrosepticum SCRI1043]|uniref:peptidoglycan lytic exotransglycosylase n=1 Tax=Pectobacterium atrosepticum (strain SCRI 1043 / ATCC BAA-672) TaxID=218491 RepID=Q6D1V4_PECAS|nr:murein transglycosylase D [Pectobacterium atrosepticum]GKV84698.1 lytic transglycosylase [Pectobacterium carotovorum subsp. carotovorum]AIA72163.1 lytic murein transglycosylase [Pectobacterium atrosepticum]AIK15131.1 Lytic transglycosylase catalytic [Pectobacterium atrosepticum]ATY91901.1 murein transglycosylase D [Pectobacterium atrosepticum]KFX15252.1 lytic murein transglycosylase [Pectobacterium atrosepticum]
MKAKAIIIASVLLVGCQVSPHDTSQPKQHAQSLSSASQSEAGKYTDGRETSARWLDDDSIAQRDLWNFIGDELKMGIPDNARIREQKTRYLKNKSYLHDVTLRAEPYMYWIVEQIKQRKMPMELVLLPIVESAFDPSATSSANAAGLWQIIPGTGRNYGLKQNQWYDGRRDVIASTTAALDMMQRLNTMFDGDWLLTVAAYNSGEGRVMQAMKANKAKGKPTNFWALALPRETSIYVPKMLALSDILKNSKKYGVNLPQPNESRALAKVELGQQIELTQAAEMAGLSLNKLKSYNSGYKRNVTAPNGPHYIMVPKAHVEQLKDSLADGDIAAIQPTRLEQTPASQQYKVRSGDTLSAIATRLNVSTKDLQSWNNLRSVGALKVGQTLQVAKASGTNGSITYQVRKGDSLASIAKRHGVNIADVMRWNTVINKNANIQPGDRLTLYVSSNIKPDS